MENQELEQKKQEIQGLVSAAQSALQELNEAKAEALNLRRNIQAKNTESQNIANSIEGLRDRASQAEQSIQAASTKISAVIADINQHQAAYLLLKKKVDDPTTGSEALFDEIERINSDVAVLKKDSDKVLIEIRSRLSDVEKVKEDVIKTYVHVKSLADDSETLKESIRENLDLVTDSVLQNAFKEREKKLQLIVFIWLGISVLSAIAFAGSVIYIFNKLAAVGFSGYSDWFRFLFLTPLLLLVLWAGKNYAQERKLLERYAFKAVISTSLTSYIKLLTDKFEEAQDEIFEFTRAALEKIYKEPYDDVDSRFKGNLSLWNVIKADVDLADTTREQIVDKVRKGEMKIDNTTL